MPRTKKQQDEIPVATQDEIPFSLNEEAESAPTVTSTDEVEDCDCRRGVQPSFRDRDGMVRGFKYQYDSYGFVDWRKHIKDEHLVLNREVYAREGIDVKILNAEEIAKLKAEATADKLLIKLDGFKDIARLRGIKSAEPVVKWDEFSGNAICHYTIHWIANRETDYTGQSHTAVASASTTSVGPNWQKYIETIASNRAFSRAVRESLCIHIVGAEEIDDLDKDVQIAPTGNPQKFLEELCAEKKLDFWAVKKYMEGAGMDIDEQWTKISDIPQKLILTLGGLIKNGKTKE